MTNQDVYYYPEDHGLRQIGSLDVPLSYEFDMLVLWQHQDGRLYWARDAGCSCPTPFGDCTSLDDLTHLTDATWAEFQAAVEQVGDADMAADRTEMLALAARALREQR